MNKYRFLLLPLAIGISGCGGGSDGMPAFDAAGFANVTQKEFSLPSGAGMATATNQPGVDGRDYNLSMFLLDETTANKVADFMQILVAQGPEIVVNSSSRSNGIYEFDVSVANKDGEIGNNFFRGTALPSDGYVSYNFINFAEEYTFATDGSIFSGSYPSAVAIYNGEALTDDRGGNFQSEYATFSMSADFSTNKADLDIFGPNSFVFAREMDIDQTQGRFDGDATMGTNNGPTNPGTVLGYFAGKDAEGVHGVVYGNADGDDVMDSMFFGVR